MESRNRRVIRTTWRTVLCVVVLSAMVLLLCIKGLLPWPHRAMELRKIRATDGFGFTAKLPARWPGFVFASESAVMTEDGRALNQVNENGIVRNEGMGRFRAGSERVLFSTSDGTDALTNGRKYAITLDAVVAPKIRAPILLGGAIAALLLLGKYLHRAASECARRMPVVSAQSWAIALFAAALAVRVGFLWLNPDYTDDRMSIRGTPFSDARDWHWMARSTAAGGGVDTTYPGMRALFPMFLANFYTWFGESVGWSGPELCLPVQNTARVFN